MYTMFSHGRKVNLTISYCYQNKKIHKLEFGK
jgi:hypothetical protein